MINIISIIIYKLALKMGVMKKLTPIGLAISGPFFVNNDLPVEPDLDLIDTRLFGWFDYSKVKTPNWKQSPFSLKSADSVNRHWIEISDFDLEIGDIKTVWELSRFNWLLEFAIEVKKTGTAAPLDKLNLWLEDWSKNNVVNEGINWKCGQEASIRVIHLCMTAFLLNQHENLTPALTLMITQHLKRISPTSIYALAQDNNHGTSEAVALYIGGLLLAKNATNKQALKWKKKGRYLIENRVKKLIMSDGSFSQHSVNYHRLMLDTICIAERFRQLFSEPSFSDKSLQKIKLSIEWLAIFTNSKTGDVPNIGANDGAKLIPLTMTDYRDYRPSVQLATALFYGKRFYQSSGKYDQASNLLSVAATAADEFNVNEKNFDKGGYIFLKNKQASLYLRYPKFRFRPSQCDIFHLDFWLFGQNIMRDAGTYSYNGEQIWQKYFPSVRAHNSVEFDDLEQMPKLSRFMYNKWAKLNQFSGITVAKNSKSFGLSYKLNDHIEHKRQICLFDKRLEVIDELSGFEDSAILRWRLIPGNYEIKGNQIISDLFTITILSNELLDNISIEEGFESRYYFQKTSLPVLTIKTLKAATITSLISWN